MRKYFLFDMRKCIIPKYIRDATFRKMETSDWLTCERQFQFMWDEFFHIILTCLYSSIESQKFDLDVINMCLT